LNVKLMAPHARFDALGTVGTTGHALAAATIAAAESATWASFARAGIPDYKSIPHWPAYSAADRATMMIDAEWRLQNDPQHEARLLWTEIALA
jgi:carboxylesterase type B